MPRMASTGHADELALVTRAARGDDRAFRLLVERHRERVQRTAGSVLRDECDAAEVAQETWIKAWRSLGAFRGEASFGTWLTRLTINTAADHIRRRAVRDAAARAGAPSPAQQPGFAAIEDRDKLRRGLVVLPEDQRRLLALRYALCLSVGEIAAVLRVPTGTVKSRLHAATAALRAALRDGGADAGHPPSDPVVRSPGLRPSGMASPGPHRASPAADPHDGSATDQRPRRAARQHRQRPEPRNDCRSRGRRVCGGSVPVVVGQFVPRRRDLGSLAGRARRLGAFGWASVAPRSSGTTSCSAAGRSRPG